MKLNERLVVLIGDKGGGKRMEPPPPNRIPFVFPQQNTS